ncbi:MAG: cyanophycin synthetase [Gaiellaceae bacterium]
MVAERPYVVVDYAHTPDALARTLRCARALCEGQLTVVFGAGGQRDKQKRPLMGCAASVADKIVLTTDNPRREDPAAIVSDIRAGLATHPGVKVELDRSVAIHNAVAEARELDVIIIAGKGHEDEQILGEERKRFSDREVALSAARASASRGADVDSSPGSPGAGPNRPRAKLA